MKRIKKIVIVEDEEANADRLQRMIFDISKNFQILTVLSSIQTSVEWLTQNDPPDLIFLDVQLSDGNSFEIFNLIDLKCPIIFTTAYDAYALKAFKYNSIDYLLKPVDKDELKKAIEKFEYLNGSEIDQNVFFQKIKDISNGPSYRTRFLVPYKDGYKPINTENISYFMSSNGSVYSVSLMGDKNLISDTLESLEGQLDPRKFFRANRQYIINITSINRIHHFFNSKLKLDIKQCNEGVFISRLKATSFKDWLNF